MYLTKSLNKIAYISTVTGQVAEIVDGKDGLNEFAIKRTDEQTKALLEYNRAMETNSELMVDIIKYNKFIAYYKKATKLYKKNKMIKDKKES